MGDNTQRQRLLSHKGMASILKTFDEECKRPGFGTVASKTV